MSQCIAMCVAVCCSVLQRVAACSSRILSLFSVLCKIALMIRYCISYHILCVIYCNALQHTATLCNTMQHAATHYNTLRHTATHCSTLQLTATHCIRVVRYKRVIVQQRSPQHTTTHSHTHCNTLHRLLQHTTTHGSTHCNTQHGHCIFHSYT